MKKKTENMVLTQKRSGNHKESREHSSTSYTLYDKCEITPLSVYIGLVCRDDLRALVADGDPSNDVLIEAKNSLLEEYHSLTNEGKVSVELSKLKAVFQYRSQVEFLILCMDAINAGFVQEALEELKSFGIRRNIPQSDEETVSLLKFLESQVKLKTVRMNEAKKLYEESVPKEDEETVTPQMFYDELAVISKFMEFEITDKVTLSQYASYKKMYNRAIDKSHAKH